MAHSGRRRYRSCYRVAETADVRAQWWPAAADYQTAAVFRPSQTMTRPRYTAEQRAEAVGLAVSVGVTDAARRLGIPHRTVSNWLASPDMRATILRSREDVAARLWEAVVAGTDAVLAGLRDPTARLSDKARALEVVAQQHALLVGDVTARTETTPANFAYADVLGLSVEEAHDMVRVIREELDGALEETADDVG